MKYFSELLNTFNPMTEMGFYHLTSLILFAGGIMFSFWLGNQLYRNYKENK